MTQKVLSFHRPWVAKSMGTPRRADLPAGGQATPMTYVACGRQYLVVAAGGHNRLGTTRGDAIIAFALPKGESRSKGQSIWHLAVDQRASSRHAF